MVAREDIARHAPDLDKRADDNEKIIINRYKTYLEKTLPILDFYEKQKLLSKINATGDIDQIFKQICGIIGSIEA